MQYSKIEIKANKRILTTDILQFVEFVLHFALYLFFHMYEIF